MTQTLTRGEAETGTQFKEEERVVLWADINGFSGMARRMGDMARVAQLFQAAYEVVGDAVTAEDGQILKYLGDAVLCLFPAGSELAAVRAGREMRRRFEAVAERFGQGGQTGLKVLIGSGPMQVGEVGHATHRGMDAFGIEMFNAVSIESKGIAVTEAARRRLGDQFRLRELPEQSKAWMAEPLRAWEIVE